MSFEERYGGFETYSFKNPTNKCVSMPYVYAISRAVAQIDNSSERCPF